MTTPASAQGHQAQRRAIPVAVLLVLAIVLQPLLNQPVAAQTASLPGNVLAAAVRIQIVIEVVPRDRDEEPFPCLLPDDTPLEAGNGSGTIVSEDGLILTNHHVMRPEDAIGEIPDEVVDYCSDQASDGRASVELTHIVWLPDERGAPSDPYTVELIEDSSMADDLALIQIDRHLDGSRVNTSRDPFPHVEFGDSDALREPEKLTLIGYPGNAGPQRRVSEGIFSGWGDNGYGVEWIFTDATSSGGSSGGTAVNQEGLFIGISSAGTEDDCRPGDTNGDGRVDEDDACIGTGGNFALLIPSNLAREFAEDATDREFPVVEGRTTPADDPTPTSEPDETPDPDGPPIGDISFYAYDEDLEEQDRFHNVTRLEACFDNLTVEEGDEGDATWYLDGDVFIVEDFAWEDAWNPQACASIFTTDKSDSPYLDPGIYTVDITINGQTVSSDERDVSRSTGVESVSIRGRNADRDTIEAEDGVLEGDFTMLYVDIEFADMESGAVWRVVLYRDGQELLSSDAEAWEGDANNDETIRLRAPDDEFEPGSYEIVVTIEGVEGARVSLDIEP